ncbi:MAG: hypothetical protein ACRD0U_17725 [Acidimicrobiales bacterium]
MTWAVEIVLYDGARIIYPVVDWQIGADAAAATRREFPGQVLRAAVTTGPVRG